MPPLNARLLPRTTFGRWVVGAGCSLLLAAGSLPAEVTREYQIKAAFVYNFTKFVEWPHQRKRPAGQPIVIGVLGHNPFGDELTDIVRGRTVGGHPFAVRLVHTPAEAATVDLLFVPAGEEKLLGDVSASLQKSGVLTVGESDGFLAANGMINFVLEGDRVRFAINLRSAEQSGLKISAQLLKLAITVFGKS